MDDFGAMPDDEAIATVMSGVLTLFDVQNLKPLQMLSLRLLVRRRDVFACFPTGFGKSLIFHLLPHVCARLALQPMASGYPADPVVLVVSLVPRLSRASLVRCPYDNSRRERVWDHPAYFLPYLHSKCSLSVTPNVINCYPERHQMSRNFKIKLALV